MATAATKNTDKKNANKDVNVEGLETVNASTSGISKHAKKAGDAPQFENREWLENNSPMDFCTTENTSSKFEKDREQQITDGLDLMSELGFPLNPLMILMAKWWEVKPARAAIKKMMDNEAKEKKTDANVYLQTIIGGEVDKLENLGQAINRIKYARTYFKPRNKDVKDVTKTIIVDGNPIEIKVALLEQARLDFKDDKDGLKKFILDNGVAADAIESL